MLSNLRISANILSKRYQRQLGSLSAVEMRSIHRRCPMLAISFDPSRYSGLTQAQIIEDQARLWWRSRSVSLADEERRGWRGALARLLLPGREASFQALDEEAVFEVLWLAQGVSDGMGDISVIARRAERNLRERLRRQGYADQDITQRLDSIGGRSEGRHGD